MPDIKCAAVICIHNVNNFCGVKDKIDMRNGIDMYNMPIAECLDYSPVSDKEYELITGKKRI